MASGLLPKSPVSSSLCDEVPHILNRKTHPQPSKFLISSGKRLLQHNLPEAKMTALYHLVGTGEQRRRHGEAERFRRFQVYDQMKLDRRFDRCPVTCFVGSRAPIC
jgi:hypothetical protein